MQTLYARICDYRNLELAFRKARKGKSRKAYVMAFEASLEMNLLLLRDELENHTYAPEPLESFILRDPKRERLVVLIFVIGWFIMLFATLSNSCLISLSFLIRMRIGLERAH